MGDWRFEWDDTKNRTNLRKHGITFEQAVEVFDDPDHATVFGGFEAFEERWLTYGISDGMALLTVAHTYRDRLGVEVIRIISARRATRLERQEYEIEHR